MIRIRQMIISNRWNFRVGRSSPLRGIVLHSEGAGGPRPEGTEASLYEWFQTNRRNVSAHYYVTFDGRVEQYVLDEDTAYQAGNIQYNACTIGIEHQDDGAEDKYTDLEYETSAQLVCYLCDKYHIPLSLAARHVPDGLTIHKNVTGAATSCPVGLDWQRIINRAQQLAASGERVVVNVERVMMPAETPDPVYEPGLYRVTANTLNVRPTPDIQFAPLAMLKKNQRVQIGSVEHGWGKVTAFLDAPTPPPSDSEPSGQTSLDPLTTPCWVSLTYAKRITE